jgi:hypothetical protein
VGAASGPKGRRGDCRHLTTAMANECPAERSGRRRHHKQQHAEAAEIHGQTFNSADFIDLGNRSSRIAAAVPSQHTWRAAPEHLRRFCREQHRAVIIFQQQPHDARLQQYNQRRG